MFQAKIRQEILFITIITLIKYVRQERALRLKNSNELYHLKEQKRTSSTCCVLYLTYNWNSISSVQTLQQSLFIEAWQRTTCPLNKQSIIRHNSFLCYREEIRNLIFIYLLKLASYYYHINLTGKEPRNVLGTWNKQ